VSNAYSLTGDFRYIVGELSTMLGMPPMNTTRSHRFIAPAAALMFGLTSGMSFADDEKEHRDNGRHNGWYKRDKDRETPKAGTKGSAISVPEPGTMVLLITGLVVVVAFARRRSGV
jgi:hypothetical protein